jgi:hypothetical protein
MRAAVAALALTCAAAPAAAWFETDTAGARAASLGDAFVAVADDASSLYWNPAGLVQLERHQLLFASDRTATVAGIHTDFIAASAHVRGATLGVAWRHLGVDGTAREDWIAIGAARTWIRRSLGAFVSTGATLEIASIGIEAPPGVPGLRGGDTDFAATLGALLQPIPNVTAGVVVRHIGQPEFDLHAGGERTRLDAEVEWGVSLRWREDGRVHFARVRTASGFTRARVGAELRVAGPLALSAGASRDAWTGGLALAVGRFTFDWAYRADADLGTTAQLGVRVALGAPRAAVGGEYDDF